MHRPPRRPSPSVEPPPERQGESPGRGQGSSLKVDLHTHTDRSLDAGTSPGELVERAVEAGLDRIAVTDHGSIEGALLARELAPDRVVVGEEVRSACGTELIGLFLEARIPRGLRVEETVERIRDQGGLVYAPHPFAYVRNPRERARTALRWADAVEVANARAFWPSWNRRGRRAARRTGLPACAGSDAHFPSELGRAFTLLPAFRDAASFRAALTLAEPVLVETTAAGMHLVSLAHKTVRLIRGPDGRSSGVAADGSGRDRSDRIRESYRTPRTPLGGPVSG